MRNMRLIMIVAAIAVILSFLCGCDDRRLKKKHREIGAELMEAASRFNKFIVWKNFDKAMEMVVPEKQMEFLEKTEHFGSMVHIEDFSVALCQTALEPFPREDDKDKAEDGGEEITPPEPEIEKPEKEKEKDTDRAEGEGKDKEKKDFNWGRLPKVYYGLALVRYINMTIMPSASVQTRLIKQHWVYVEKTWYCDFDIEEILE